MFIKKLTTIFFVLLIALLNLGDNPDNVYEVSDFGLNERVSYHNDYSFRYLH